MQPRLFFSMSLCLTTALTLEVSLARKGRSFLCCFLVSAVAFMLGSLEIEGKQEKSLV
jgi:hypothetical protein